MMNYENIEFEKDSVFLVTGGAGFIGSNLCEKIIDMGYEVICFDNLSTGNIKNIELLIEHPKFKFIKGDIRDFDMCVDVTKGVDFVLHQAAWGSVPRSIKLPLLYEEINIHGTLNMLEAARRCNVKRFVYASSSSVYGDSKALIKVEGNEGRVLSPYALTKKVNEEYAQIYSNLYGLSTVGLRYFNVFGKRQNPEGQYAAVIPKFINMIRNGEKPIIYGDGMQSRDFTYIENVIEANLKSCFSDKIKGGEILNIAFGGNTSLNELVNYMGDILNVKVEPIYSDRRVGDITHSNASISRATSLIDYNPNWDLFRGMNELIKGE